jgi:ketosteroid isomerase-like protein
MHLPATGRTSAAVLLLCCALRGAMAQPASASTAPAARLAEMQQVENAWDDAIAKHDQYALENLLAADYIGISAEGDVTTRNQQIAHMFVAGAEPLSLKQTVITVRPVGDAVLVNGTYVMEWPDTTAKEQAKVAEKGVFTQVFRRNGAGGWQCISSQRTVVATEAERKQQAAKVRRRSSSNADLPLHIPLVYSGPTGNPSAGAPAKPQ